MIQGLTSPIWNTCHTLWPKESKADAKFYNWNYYTIPLLISYSHNLWTHRRAEDKKINPNPELDRLRLNCWLLQQNIKDNPSIIMSHDTARLIVTSTYFDTCNRTLLITWKTATQSSINMKTKLEENNQSRITDFFPRLN